MVPFVDYFDVFLGHSICDRVGVYISTVLLILFFASGLHDRGLPFQKINETVNMILLHIAMGMGVVSLAINIWVLVQVRFKLEALPDVRSTPPIKLVVTERPAAKLFNTYLKAYKKQYEGEELTRRFGIFKDSLKEISRMNRESGATFGVTKFSDMSSEELMSPSYNRTLAGSCTPFYRECSPGPHTGNNYHQGEPIPNKFNWKDKGYVGPVLDQKQCNGCWAFGIIGAMETQAARLHGELGPRLSIQELIDCSVDNEGCDSGNVVLALNWLCNNHWGIVTEKQYPLQLVTQTCKFGKYPPVVPVGAQLKGFQKLCNMYEDAIPEMVYYHGPVIVVVNADPWLGYKEGVIQWGCVRHKSVTRDHVVQIVGYDKSSDTDVPHYIVRNSWGDDFGEEGYVKLAMGKNVCGVADEGVLLNVYGHSF